MRIRRLWIAVVLMGSLCANASEWPPSLFPTVAQMDALRSDSGWGGFRHACSKDMSLVSHPVADFSPAPHYDATGPAPDSDNSPGRTLSRESLAVYQLAVCFDISRDARFSGKAEGILEGWARTTKRIGTLQGADGFNFYFPEALMGAYLLESRADWKSSDFSEFVRQVVLPANNAARENNHGNWGVLLLATAGGFLKDRSTVMQARQRWMDLLDGQVAADGSLPLETCRSNTSNWCGGPAKGIKGIGYTHYALHPTALAAEIFQNLGLSVYGTAESTLLCKAYSRAAFWTLHPEQFPYFKSNHGQLEGVHDIDYFYILQRRCPAPDGAAVLREFGPGAPDALDLRGLYPANP